MIDTWEYNERLRLPLTTKVRMTSDRIKEWVEKFDGKVYVSFSGGKDSTVLLHIARKLYLDVPGVFIDTGLEYPEIRQFAKTYDNVVVLKPKLPFHQVVEKYGYPVISKHISQAIYEVRNTRSDKLRKLRLTGIGPEGNYRPWSMISKKWQFLVGAPFKISHRCCDILKKDPAKLYEKETGRKPIIGSMASESKTRERNYLKHGCNVFSLKRPVSNPMSFWTTSDVLQYIVENDCGYASVYGDICKFADGTYDVTGEPRTGCMFCAFGVHTEGSPNKFERMNKTHPKQWDYVVNRLFLGNVLDFLGISYS